MKNESRTLTERARELRKSMTREERSLWYRLRAKQIRGVKFRRQEPVGGYIVDFVCMPLRLVVELDGGDHADQCAYDDARDRNLWRLGYRVLRFWNHDVLDNLEGVLEAIDRAVIARMREIEHPHPGPPPMGEGKESTDPRLP